MNVTTTPKRSFSDQDTYDWAARTLRSMRLTMEDMGVAEIAPAILSTEIEAGAFHSVGILSEFDRLRALSASNPTTLIAPTTANTFYLPFSHNFEKQQAVEFLKVVYGLIPCVRPLKPEEHTSGKHLNTFFEIEIEAVTRSKDTVLSIAERFLAAMGSMIEADVATGRLRDSPAGARNRASLRRGAFPRITFAEALARVDAPTDRLVDLSGREDRALCMQFETPFWIHDYPREVRDAVYHENENGRYETFDLMLPFGYGELATGGVRPRSGEAIMRQSLGILREDPATLTHGHAEWKRTREIQTAGLGIGYERLQRFLSGSQTVFDFVPAHDRGPNRRLL